jgi:hypothetical protein
MNRKIVIIVALQAFIIVVLFWLLVFYGKDEYEAATSGDEEAIESVSHVVTGSEDKDGAATISLSPASQQQSGIAAVTLQPAAYQEQISYLGTVVGIESLVELRTRYLAAKADTSVAQASLNNSQQEYQRLRQLNGDNKNVSDRAVAVAEAALKADQARVDASVAAAGNVRDSIRQQWGSTLADWATGASGKDAFQRLLQYHDVLLQITLPFDASTPDKHAVLLVEPMGGQGAPSKAVFISASPQTDTTIQGKTFYYRAAADILRAGMRVTARFASRNKDATGGVVVPDTAVVWYANKAWVYQKEGVDKFVRRQVSTDIEVDSKSGIGWFNASGFKPGDKVVSSGAQLLLSEEFKYQITNENDD